ncbi:MAG: hypothetical protein JSW27_11200 [Phycisphaerales bacterium]|nr:MAG: hypothetical protein JSW27_11200 [Phycisphaerales bacterium]
MLLNLVKLRYGDAPAFLEVSSIISQYSLETTVDASASWIEGLTGDSTGVGGGGRYIDRPTITYSPLVGDKFTRELLTPIPPTSIFSMVQAGWPVDRVFQICVQSINGLDNRAGMMALARKADPDFYHLLLALRRVQQSGGVSIRVREEQGQTATIIVFDRDVDNRIRADINTVRRLLNLDPNGHEFSLAYGRSTWSSSELAILSRSMMEILMEMATHVEVPPRDLDEGRVRPVLEEATQMPPGLSHVMRIYWSEQEPTDAFVAVPYRGQWFWIDDRDPLSRGTLTFLMILFSLAETGTTSGAPVVTIPAG